jgi:hypothetical protein
LRGIYYLPHPEAEPIRNGATDAAGGASDHRGAIREVVHLRWAHLGALAPALGFAHLITGDETAATATAGQLATVVPHATGLGRTHDLAVFQDARHGATHQTMQLEP